ncbi:transposase [Puniceicoccus vermicola]|uniref:Transposase n=1 Tax=Puniceicoccus vermicola TaxID=388746 RepID=A0A7X1B090_9BACT|nr:transposase [Puniceicoccus vermicola]MBC2603069.1 transposase [Puniceicoccus vermicola]
MRKGRVVLKGVDSVFHCMSRTVNGERVFGPDHLKKFRDVLARVADFSGVSVITYCLMENHFHVLVRIPAEDRPSDKELVRRFRVLYPKPGAHPVLSPEKLEDILSSGGDEAEQLRAVLMARMGCVSEFMKTLKQRFSVWFNSVHRRYGPLWSDRFKSVLLEGDEFSLKTVAAYIDLNPVRAGIVADPKDYSFSGYGRAVAGGRFERRALEALGGWVGYRSTLFGKGGIEEESREDGQEREAEADPAPVGFRSASLLQTIRHFSNGKILGSEGFVRRILDEFEVIHEGVTRRRCPVDVGNHSGLFSGTRVRRPKTCLADRDSV